MVICSKNTIRPTELQIKTSPRWCPLKEGVQTMPSWLVDLFTALGFVYTVIGIPGLIFVLLAIRNAEKEEE